MKVNCQRDQREVRQNEWGDSKVKNEKRVSCENSKENWSEVKNEKYVL